jgi:hypothetical protein
MHISLAQGLPRARSALDPTLWSARIRQLSSHPDTRPRAQVTARDAAWRAPCSVPSLSSKQTPRHSRRRSRREARLPSTRTQLVMTLTVGHLGRVVFPTECTGFLARTSNADLPSVICGTSPQCSPFSFHRTDFVVAHISRSSVPPLPPPSDPSTSIERSGEGEKREKLSSPPTTRHQQHPCPHQANGNAAALHPRGRTRDVTMVASGGDNGAKCFLADV